MISKKMVGQMRDIKADSVKNAERERERERIFEFYFISHVGLPALNKRNIEITNLHLQLQ